MKRQSKNANSCKGSWKD